MGPRPAGALSARPAYLEQVRRIAPPDPPGLVGREEELAGLARVCLDPDGVRYAWWQAEAWAGKSALLSTFVLRPPPEATQRGVRIVSFFITARLAAQDTRDAFIQVVLEQLAGLLGRPRPAALPEATREAHLLGLMSEAAAACAQGGGRLVLAVDGLDEDHGVTTGPGAHSIAGLLPADPPHGMLVIVASRSNPPVPDDVPDWHPLRDPRIIRPLTASPYARDVKRLSKQELQRLLQGTAAEQDVLGLLAAARGGLSARDLEELAGVPLWEVEKILHTAAGRTFTRRASRWAPATGPETYLLGHEELQAAAEACLGGERLAASRERLHAWADAWRVRGWPPGTPEYLLGGYFRLAQESGDMPRMIEYAGDLARYDRMVDVTAEEVAAAALAEARTGMDRIAAQDTPDLGALALACHRDQLTSRNAGIPVGLPAIWASLGQPLRAEALAASIAGPAWQAMALAQIAEALAEARQHEQAKAVAGKAEEAAARSITDPAWQPMAMAQVARALATTGQHEQANAVAGSITGPNMQALTHAEVAEALAAAGQHGQAVAVAGQAEAAARSITDRYMQARALTQIARALAAAGQHEQAAAVAGQAEAVAASITGPFYQARALAQIARALAAAGQHEQAAAVAGQAEAVAASITGPYWQARALVEVARALATAGQHEQANAVAGSITDPSMQALTHVEVAEALAAAGQHGQAVAVAGQAVAVAGQAAAVAGSITGSYRQVRALTQVARVLAAAGQHEQAKAVAGQAVAVAGQAEAAARSITGPDCRRGR